MKFKDADLIGIPLRITIGSKRLSEGNVEVKIRKSGDIEIIPIDQVVDYVMDMTKAS